MSDARQLSKLISMDVHLKNIELVLNKVHEDQGGVFEKIAAALEKLTGLPTGGAEKGQKKYPEDKPEEKSESNVGKMVGELGKFGNLFVQGVTKFMGFVSGSAEGVAKDARSAKDSDTSVGGYKAIAYAAGQTGVDADFISESLKNVAAFWKQDAAGEGMLNNMGIQTRRADGSQADNADVFTQVSRSVSAMDPGTAEQFSGALGMNEQTLNAMRQGMAQYTEQYHQMMTSTGIDAEKAAVQSTQFMTSMRKITAVSDLIRDKVGTGLAAGLIGPVESITTTILANFPKIEATVNQVVGGISGFATLFANAINGTIGWVSALIGLWQQLDSSTQIVIAVVTALAAAWFLLGTAFRLSPIGIILTLATAIGLVYDEYAKWKSGGDTFIDWGKWGGAIGKASAAIGKLITTVKNLVLQFWDMLKIDFSSWSIDKMFDGLIGGFEQLGTMLQKVGRLINALKEGSWSEAASIGKEMMNDVSNSPVGKLFQQGKELVNEGVEKADNWLNNGEKKDTRRPDSAALISPQTLDNLENSHSLMGGYGLDQARYAYHPDLSQSASTTVNSPTINNESHIVINGASDPLTTGNFVASRMTDTYSRLAQQNIPGIT
jgi:hypothetical protein